MINNQVKIIRVINSPIEKVWNAWVNPESLKQWKSPEGMTTPSVSVDLKIGGRYAVSMQGGHAEDKVLTVRGIY